MDTNFKKFQNFMTYKNFKISKFHIHLIYGYKTLKKFQNFISKIS